MEFPPTSIHLHIQTLAKPLRSFVVAPTCHSLLSLDIPKTWVCVAHVFPGKSFHKETMIFSGLKESPKQGNISIFL